MKIKDGFITREIAGECVAVAIGERSREFRGMITLNETGRLLWSLMQDETDEKALCEALLAEYDVSEDAALEAVRAFVARLKEEGLLA